jgi:hypothetical protein
MDPLTAQHSSISPCGGGVPLLSACRLPSGSRPVARIPAPRRLMEKANGSRAPAGSNTPGVAPCARRARRVCRGRPPGRRRCPRRGAGDCQCSRDGAASVNRGRLAERGSEVEDGEECLTSEPLLPSIVRQRLVQLQSPLPNRHRRDRSRCRGGSARLSAAPQRHRRQRRRRRQRGTGTILLADEAAVAGQWGHLG